MFEKNMRLAVLLDFYGEALDGRDRRIMEAYYEDDLSLSEIADGEGISRQGVRHLIKKCEDQLEFFEERLGLSAHYRELVEAAKMLDEIRTELLSKGDEFSAMAESISDVVTTIMSKGI